MVETADTGFVEKESAQTLGMKERQIILYVFNYTKIKVPRKI
jgi:hypothetical protein